MNDGIIRWGIVDYQMGEGSWNIRWGIVGLSDGGVVGLWIGVMIRLDGENLELPR